MNLIVKESSDNSKARDCLKFKKGYSLTELLILLAIIAVISIPISRLSNVVIFYIPKSLKLIESDEVIRNAISFIKDDVDSALNMSKTEKGQIIIEQNDKTITYTFQDDVINRNVEGSGEKITWRIENGKINCRVWEKQGKGYAVEIQKYVENERSGMVEKKMKNSYVFFAGMIEERTK